MRGRSGAHRDGVSFINLELCRFVFVGAHAGGEEVEEGTEEVKVLPCHVGHLEYRTDPREGDGEEIEMFILLVFSSFKTFTTQFHDRKVSVCVCVYLSEVKLTAEVMTSS